jgi:hypothetical protein
MINPLFEDLEFEVEKEVWNEYEVEDGNYRVTLKMRSILIKVLQPRIMQPSALPLIGVPKDALPSQDAHKKDLQLSFQNIVVISNCPTELMGTPTPPNSQDVNQLKTEEVNFTTFKEDWNTYMVSPPTGQKLKIKLIVTTVRKIQGAYDQFGYPMYLVQSTNMPAPISSKFKK